MARRTALQSIGLALVLLGFLAALLGLALFRAVPVTWSVVCIVAGMFLLSHRSPRSTRRRSAGGPRLAVKTPAIGDRGAAGRGAFSGRRGLTVLAILSLVGAAAIGTGAYHIHRDLATPWSIVDGTVLRSEVVTHRSSDSTTWSPLIAYGYTYEEREYRGAYQPGYSSGDYSGAQRLVDDHPLGSRVEVKVDPADPRESRLRLGFATENFGWILALGVGSLFAAPSAWALRRGLRRETPHVPGSAELPEYGTAYAVVECPSCHQLVEPARKWGGNVKCPRCGAKLE